ncbi:hypothetical protein Q8W40_19665 [Vibrio penaeicida]|uniref:hypothetical protein n=1 Tax=Vibrio penaeicida TaxID=104609 RepID=UPI0027356426|nr:hypothetical protein [Vibrio penaeicida]MDP2574419.1 hypothetical protein [Vibrio penaeicida]
MRLKKFKPSELNFNDAETKEILIFFFPSSQSKIKQAPMDLKLKEFAQGLLLEAIDASYKIGFVQGLWEATINPREPLRKVISKLIQNTASHMFHHATTKDLRDVKVYDFVVKTLSLKFKSTLELHLNGIAKNQPLLVPTYRIPAGRLKVWA